MFDKEPSTLRDFNIKMTRNMDLPTELIPEVLQFILKPTYLASACLVNHAFYEFGIRLLYRRVVIHPWQKSRESMVIKLFSTLSLCPNLARFVHFLGKECWCPKFAMLNYF